MSLSWFVFVSLNIYKVFVDIMGVEITVRKMQHLFRRILMLFLLMFRVLDVDTAFYR